MIKSFQCFEVVPLIHVNSIILCLVLRYFMNQADFSTDLLMKNHMMKRILLCMLQSKSPDIMIIMNKRCKVISRKEKR